MNNKAISKKGNRRFLNMNDKTCMAAVHWEVEVWSPYKEGKKHDVEANFAFSKEANYHYVTNKADLKPLRVAITELTRFEAECLSAFDKVEELDAKSKK